MTKPKIKKMNEIDPSKVAEDAEIVEGTPELAADTAAPAKQKKVSPDRMTDAEIAEKLSHLPEGEDPLLAAKREAAEEERLKEESERFDRADARGLIAPVGDDLPFEDDLMTEKEVIAEKERRFIEELTAILKVPKTKDSIMTFSMYSTSSFNRRYFILDVDGNAYREGWRHYKEVKGDDPVGYLEMVIHIMDLEIPRLHRAVDWVPLN